MATATLQATRACGDREKRGCKAECFLVDAPGQFLDATTNKDKAAADTAWTVVETASPFAIDLMMPAFLSGLSVTVKLPQKEATLNMIKDFAARNPKATDYALVPCGAGRGPHLRH